MAAIMIAKVSEGNKINDWVLIVQLMFHVLFFFTDKARGLNANTVICYRCGYRNYKELAYEYRSNLGADSFPSE